MDLDREDAQEVHVGDPQGSSSEMLKECEHVGDPQGSSSKMLKECEHVAGARGKRSKGIGMLKKWVVKDHLH